MNHLSILHVLARHETLLPGLLEGVDQEQAAWRPAPGSWSLLDVVAHLLDEEREDFRPRLEMTLMDPQQEWPPIDPQGWVDQRAYGNLKLPEVLTDWRRERAASLAWLRGLTDPPWEQAHRHPDGFSMRAGDLLAAWAAHDLIHLRQLARLHLLWLKREARPFVPDYAGPVD